MLISSTFVLRWVIRYKIWHSKQTSSAVSEAMLKEMEESLTKFHDKFKVLIIPHLSREGNTIKYHKLSHAIEWIRRFGPLINYDANFFEQMHQV